MLHQERRGQVKTIVMEHFNGILFHKSGPANNQHSNQQIIPIRVANLLGVIKSNVSSVIRAH